MVDGSSKAIFDNRSISKSFLSIISDNLCGTFNLILKSKTQSTKPWNDLFFNSVYGMKTEIESEFGAELKWEHTKGATTTRITGPYTEDCGWGTDDELRRENIPSAINDMEGFIQTLSTYIDKAYESINSELMELNL